MYAFNSQGHQNITCQISLQQTYNCTRYERLREYHFLEHSVETKNTNNETSRTSETAHSCHPQRYTQCQQQTLASQLELSPG